MKKLVSVNRFASYNITNNVIAVSVLRVKSIDFVALRGKFEVFKRKNISA